MSKSSEDAEFEAILRKTFLEEAADIVQNIDSVLLNLKAYDLDAYSELFRGAHTIKGSAASAGFPLLSKFVHRFENFLTLLKQGDIETSQEVIDFLLLCGDAVRSIIVALADSHNEVEVMETFAGTIELQIDQRLQKDEPKVIEPDAGFGFFDDPPPVPEPPSTNSARTQPEPNRAPVAAKFGSPQPQTMGASIKVDAEKLTKLLDIAGELITLNSDFERHKLQLIKAFPELKPTLMSLNKMVRSLHDVSQNLRMVPIKPIFQKMQRIVRDLAKKTGKPVIFDASGENTEVEKSLVELLDGPLVHIMRNAIDHGIESFEVRKSAEKSPDAKVTMRAYHEGSYLVVEIADDGGGINRTRVRAKAVENGIIKEDQVLSDEDTLNLIFHAGFSTTDTVTDVSGRGVGMDVVRTTVQGLKGSIGIQSTEGKGSTFTIKIPLSMSIVDGMMVMQSQQSFVIPLDSIEETVQPRQADLSAQDGSDELLNVRGEAVHIRYLSTLLGLDAGNQNPCDGYAMIVRCNGRRYGIIVDRICGRGQVVTKSIGKQLSEMMPGVNGAAVTDGGIVSLIIDPKKLIERREAS